MTSAFNAGYVSIVAVLVLCILCGTVAVVDITAMIIPDELNGFIAISGLLQAGFLTPGTLSDSVLAAGVGGLLTIGLRALHRHLRGVEGLGWGDVKFTIAAGTWTGLLDLSLFLLVAAMTGLTYVAARSVMGFQTSSSLRIPFGPFLAFGLCVIASARLLTGVAVTDLVSSLPG